MTATIDWQTHHAIAKHNEAVTVIKPLRLRGEVFERLGALVGFLSYPEDVFAAKTEEVLGASF